MRERTLPALAALLIVAAFFGAALVRYLAYSNGDYLITASVPCDAAGSSCFVAESGEGIEVGCDGVPYARATLAAREAPACLEEHSCATFSCEGRQTCTVAFCSDDVVGDGERCTGPSEADRP